MLHQHMPVMKQGVTFISGYEFCTRRLLHVVLCNHERSLCLLFYPQERSPDVLLLSQHPKYTYQLKVRSHSNNMWGVETSLKYAPPDCKQVHTQEQSHVCFHGQTHMCKKYGACAAPPCFRADDILKWMWSKLVGSRFTILSVKPKHIEAVLM